MQNMFIEFDDQMINLTHISDLSIVDGKVVIKMMSGTEIHTQWTTFMEFRAWHMDSSTKLMNEAFDTGFSLMDDQIDKHFED